MTASLSIMSPWQFDSAQGNLILRVDYDSNSNPIYQGWAQPGTAESESSWRLVKNTYDSSSRFTGNAFAQDSHSNPSCAFGFSWTNRASYTYS